MAKVTAQAGSLDAKELVSLVEDAAGSFAFSSESFAEVCVIFEAIAAATQSRSLAHRLAKLGARISEDLEGSFEGLRDAYNAHSERCLRAVKGVAAEVNHD